MAPTPAFERAARRAFELVLHLYPSEYRDEYRRELTLLFVDRLRAERSPGTRVLTAARALCAVVLEAPREHGHVLVQDLRLALRMARRDALFAGTAIGTIAAGIGLATAVFSVGKALLVDALPYRDADRIVVVWVSNPRQGFDRDFTSYPRLLDWREQSRLVESFAAFTSRQVVVTGAGDAEQLRVAQVTPEFFGVMGARPIVGGLLPRDEGRREIVLGYGLWQRRFGGDPAVAGRTLRVDSTPYIVAGVLPRTFTFPDREVEAWVPLNPTPEDRAARGSFWLRSVARLAPGVTIRQAGQEMHAIARRLSAQHVVDRDLDVALVSLRDEIAGPFRPAVYLLLAAVAGVLLIACVNVAGMLTARGAARRGEVVIRTALGAGRRRVVRQLTTEAAVLFGAGGVLGVALGWTLLRVLVGMAPPPLGWLRDVSLDGAMLAFMLGLAVVSGVVFGVVPSWKATGAEAVEVLGSGSRSAGSRGISRRFRTALVVVQVSTATVVVVTTCLLVRSLVLLQAVDLGFEPKGVLAARLELSGARYRDAAARRLFFERLIERVRGLPGVTGVAGGSSVLLGRLPNSSSFTIEGRAATIQEPLTFDVVTPDFFRLLQVQLVRGRTFSGDDRPGGPPVALINERAARKYWPDSDPIGQRFKFGDLGDGGTWRTIVGVVADTRRAGVDHPVFIESYHPFTQDPRSMTLLVRTNGAPEAIAPLVRAVVRDLDKDQALGRVAALDELVGEQVASRRFNTWLLGLFAAAATGLTAIGLYGLLAYLVVLRRHEMAVRLAVGATRRDVLTLVLRDASLVVAVGVGLGLAGALAVGGWLRALLFGIRPTDVMSLAASVVLLAGVGLVAAWAPARRAMTVDPAVTLRAS